MFRVSRGVRISQALRKKRLVLRNGERINVLSPAANYQLPCDRFELDDGRANPDPDYLFGRRVRRHARG